MNIKKLNKIIISTIICVIFFSLFSLSVHGEEKKRYGDYLYYNEIDEDKDGINDYIDISGCSIDAVTVDIPAEIDGLPVKRISIGFYSCDQLTAINVAEDNEEYYSIDGVLFNRRLAQIVRYPIGKKNTEFSIPDGIKSIHSSTFLHSSLSKIIIPDSVTNIYASAFSECHNLIEVKLPKNLAKIEGVVFKGCEKLSQIKAPFGNTNYCSENGVLFNKDKTELIAFPPAKNLSEYVVPEGVINIFDCAFYGSKNLTNVTIPESVKSIMDEAFSCSGIKNIIIPKNVTSIGAYVFSYCENLEKVIIYNSNSKLSVNAFIQFDSVLYAEENSVIEKYAQDTKKKFEKAIKGDADSSGKFDIRDARFIAKMCSKKTKFLLPPWSDYNGDDKCSIKDAADIAKYLANSKLGNN